jgi:hypothetical protein
LGGSAIEASKIAGHSDIEMTGDYTFVTPERQNELTQRIQEKLADATMKKHEQPAGSHPPGSEAPPALADAKPATAVVQ